MTKIENPIQYEWAVKRVEYLLPLVDDDTPLDNPNSIELYIYVFVDNIVHILYLPVVRSINCMYIIRCKITRVGIIHIAFPHLAYVFLLILF